MGEQIDSAFYLRRAFYRDQCKNVEGNGIAKHFFFFTRKGESEKRDIG